jgi:hypothetical protein
MNKHRANKESIDRACLMLLKTQQAQRHHSDRGYAMLAAVALSLVLLSLLSIYLFSSRLYKSSANAIVDGSTTFYAAESGMNKRAHITHGKFVGFSQPDGVVPGGASPAERMATCIAGTAGQQGSGDFQCTTEYFDYYDQIDSATGILDNSRKRSKSSDGSKYAAYTFVQPNPQNLPVYPNARKIPAGEVFAGLNAIEYTYRIYATAQRSHGGTNPNVAAQTMLQMDFNSRVIPLFQFAAFYENDLEINPSPDMSLNGPVHTNGKLFMAPGNDLKLEGQVTSVGDMYNSMGFVSNHSKGTPQIRVKIGSGPTDYYDISTLIAWTEADHLITPAELTAANGKLRPKIDRLDIPSPGFLSKTGEYYTRADMQVEFTPNSSLAVQPFKINSIFKTATGTATTSTLTDGSLRSLRQPVMLVKRSVDEQTAFCGGVPAFSLSVSLTDPEKVIANQALAAAIAAQPTPIAYSAMNTPLSDSSFSQLRTTFDTYLDDTSLKSKKQAQLLNASPKEIAALTGNCFVPAPFQVVTVNDRREGRNIQVLQTNIRSLAIWNRDGRAVQIDVAGAVTSTFAGIGTGTAGQIYNMAAADTGAPAGSLRKFGLSATDRTEGGLVWHFNINTTNVSTEASATKYYYAAGQSIYGFGFSDGKNLPAPLTLATSQAIYLQGDYNTIDGQAAAVMGDTIAVLSNACSNADKVISCGDLNDGSGNPVKGTYTGTNAIYSSTPSQLPVATETTIRAAFLSQTDRTVLGTGFRYSGGLNNYIRMLERWEGIPLNYTGSFISLGSPVEFSGPYKYGISGGGGDLVDRSQTYYFYYYPPIRNFAYDSNFNVASQLPPLTPKVVYLNQKVFKRDYDSNRN